jgi:hypothetical protein
LDAGIMRESAVPVEEDVAVEDAVRDSKNGKNPLDTVAVG